jgi:transcriptional regulator
MGGCAMMQPLELTVDELLKMRERGLSNHDIAASLGVSYSTIRRRIGNQGCKMESLTALKDTPRKPMVTINPEVNKPKSFLVPLKESYKSNEAEYQVDIDHTAKTFIISDSSGSSIILNCGDVDIFASFVIMVASTIGCNIKNE